MRSQQLRSAAKKRVPYRSSRLTMLLRDSFETEGDAAGKARTVVIVTVAPGYVPPPGPSFPPTSCALHIYGTNTIAMALPLFDCAWPLGASALHNPEVTCRLQRRCSCSPPSRELGRCSTHAQQALPVINLEAPLRVGSASAPDVGCLWPSQQKHLPGSSGTRPHFRLFQAL